LVTAVTMTKIKQAESIQTAHISKAAGRSLMSLSLSGRNPVKNTCIWMKRYVASETSHTCKKLLKNLLATSGVILLTDNGNNTSSLSEVITQKHTNGNGVSIYICLFVWGSPNLSLARSQHLHMQNIASLMCIIHMQKLGNCSVLTALKSA